MSSRGRTGEDAEYGDSIDRVVREWARERPDLPVAPMGVITRVGRLRSRFDEELADLFAGYDLSSADFAVIASLRRAGTPYTLPQSLLMNRLGLTSGTVSVRLSRLERKAVVTRSPSPDDARGTLVTLTDKGAELFDKVAPAHLHNEDVLLSALTAPERAQLEDLLRKLVASFEHEDGIEVFGALILPAHVSRRMRSAVGLGDLPGLLVSQVRPGSAADAASLREGDLLVELDGDPLLSCIALARHVQHQPMVAVKIRRGTRTHTLTIRT